MKDSETHSSTQQLDRSGLAPNAGHRLLEPHEAAIRAAAETAGLDFTMKNEGIVYAFSPGTTGDTE